MRRRGLADGEVHLGKLQACTHGEEREHIRACRTGPHGLRELAVRLLQVASMHGKAGRGGERQHARGVIVHPMLVSDGERSFQMLGRLRPSPAIHRQHCELGLAVDMVSVFPSVAPTADDSANRAPPGQRLR